MRKGGDCARFLRLNLYFVGAKLCFRPFGFKRGRLHRIAPTIQNAAYSIIPTLYIFQNKVIKRYGRI